MELQDPVLLSQSNKMSTEKTPNKKKAESNQVSDAKNVPEKQETTQNTDVKNIEEAKKEEKKIEKKNENKELAVARGYGLRISRKWAGEICRLIMGRSPEAAVSRLEEVLSYKRPVPMASREVPHQKGPGIAGARYPKNASLEMIKLLKQLSANASVNGVGNPVIVLAKADKAPSPFKRGGTRSKRTHVYLEVRDKTKLAKRT